MLELLLFIFLFLLVLFALANLPYWFRWRSKRYGTARVLRNSKIIKHKYKGIVVDGRRSLSQKISYQHFLVSCSSGSGKSTTNIIPSIIKWPESLIISDVKNELYHQLSPGLKKDGYQIITLNLADIAFSQCFNPLSYLTNQSEIKLFCKMIMEMDSNGREDKFWSSGSELLLIIIVRCLVNTLDENYMNVANLLHALNQARAENQLDDLKPFVLIYGKSSKDDDTIELFDRLRQSETKILAGWVAGAIAAASAAFDTREVKYLTAKNEIDFSQLRQQKTALFIITTPGQSLVYKPFLSLFYFQLLTFLRDAPVNKHDQGIACCLDEFGNLGKISGFPNITSLVRSKRVSLNISLQDIQQLVSTYSQEDASVILSNISSHLLLPGNMSPKTLSYYEELLGKETKEEFDPNTGKMNINSRQLFYKDEIRRLSKAKNEALLLHSDLNPVRLKTKPIFKNKSLMKKGYLRSKDGQLISSLPSLQGQPRYFDPIQYLDFMSLKMIAAEKLQADTLSQTSGLIINIAETA